MPPHVRLLSKLLLIGLAIGQVFRITLLVLHRAEWVDAPAGDVWRAILDRGLLFDVYIIAWSLSIPALLLSAARMRVDTDTPGSREKAGTIRAETANEVRRISHALMPGTLAKLGLPDALHELADGLSGKGGPRVEVHAHGFRERPSATVETGLYRIVQEALKNTVKHAHAATATVDLSVEDGRRVSLVVTDDGRGFDATDSGGNGHGADNIRSRATLLGGTAVVHSTPGQGTQWEISIPLHA